MVLSFPRSISMKPFSANFPLDTYPYVRHPKCAADTFTTTISGYMATNGRSLWQRTIRHDPQWASALLGTITWCRGCTLVQRRISECAIPHSFPRRRPSPVSAGKKGAAGKARRATRIYRLRTQFYLTALLAKQKMEMSSAKRRPASTQFLEVAS